MLSPHYGATVSLLESIKLTTTEPPRLMGGLLSGKGSWMDWGGVLPLRQMGAKEKTTEVGGGGCLGEEVETQSSHKHNYKIPER